MKNRQYFCFILFFMLQMCIAGEVLRAEEGKGYIDPGFALLLKLYPRDKEIANPMVPRISAQTAFNLYKEGKAIFFAAGGENYPLMAGAIQITGNFLVENPPMKFLKEHEDKMVVIYCH